MTFDCTRVPPATPADGGPSSPLPLRLPATPTWGPTSSGAFQTGVSRSRAAGSSGAPGSGSTTSAMGGTDAGRTEPGSCAAVPKSPPRRRALSACAAGQPRHAWVGGARAHGERQGAPPRSPSQPLGPAPPVPACFAGEPEPGRGRQGHPPPVFLWGSLPPLFLSESIRGS